MGRLTYRPELDGLRGIAVIAVVAWHAWVPVMAGGSLGVDVFFVLSGFLITSLIAAEVDQTGRFEILRFWGRRARRLAPALLLMLTAYISAVLLLSPPGRPMMLIDAGFASSYLMNFSLVLWPRDSYLIHTWSLAAEAQFYLCFPLVLIALSPLGQKTASRVLLGAWAIMTVARVAGSWLGWAPSTIYYAPHLHSTGLLLGAAVALRPFRADLGRVGLAVAVAILLAVNTRDARAFVYAAPLVEAATALVVLSPPRLMAWRPLAWVGKISYGLYLWHLPVWLALRQFPVWREVSGGETIALFGATLAVSLLVAAISYYAVEQPILRRRSRPQELYV